MRQIILTLCALVFLVAPLQAREEICLAKAIYFEARGENELGRLAVGQVVLNRMKSPKYPNTICGVVYQGCQFSFTCDGLPDRVREKSAWKQIKHLTSALRRGRSKLPNRFKKATHFHAKRVKPAWRKKIKRLGTIGSHIFYREF